MTEFIAWAANNRWCIPAAFIFVTSVWAICLTAFDKRAASKRPDRRVRETTLFAVSALGGSVAMLLTMLIIRHKTLHKRFMIGIPVIILLQAAAIAALAYFGIISY